ncbi:Dinitrogenase iron-molybdenum cofactor biosynthesis protein [Ferroglobus placidus DSM 10642]|uniref:Dinitrogenase iron-molybdenum cofactor biosynthesis protein n=1 Tax=Ferroglobus placidus (strain DSM 10642 / AEDII12DO) TaxID=589924 RepID=D3RWI9_FERPA|nr:NifB/NifX family molybdenum-iron cluster-binding protein [Ferroglobus placidus]ADC64852.1 Dinitrogenase iron-molybdenum cofactor biosynthesis protein [Ferroglobus placidus DSM 10642]
MKVAIPTDDGVRVSEHFGRAKFVYITDGKESKLVENPHVPKRGHKALPRLLKEEGVEVVFAKHVGEGMRENLKEFGIRVEIVGEDEISKLVDRLKSS